MSGPIAWNAPRRLARTLLLLGAVTLAASGCREAALFTTSTSEGGFGGGSAGATTGSEPPISALCSADVACELPGVTLYAGADVGVTLDPDPGVAPGGYAFVPGAPSVRVGLPGQVLDAPVRILFELGRRPPTADMAVLFDTGDERSLLLSDFVQTTVMAELDVGGLVRLVRIVPDRPPGCPELRRSGGKFDITDLGELLGVTHVDGNLTLTGPLSESLATLSCLVSVEGDLTIAHTQGLLSLDGLEQLTIVGGKLLLEDNPDLRHADLPGLEGRVGGLTLARHPKLELFATGDLLDVVGPLVISENGQAARFLDLDLYFVRRIRGHADFVANEGWSMDRSLGLLEVVEGRVSILQNGTLETLDDLLSLRRIGANLEIGNNPDLRSAFGLGLVTELGGSVHIHDNPGLELVDLGSVVRLPGDLSITHNASASPALRLDLGALEVIEGRLELSYNRNWDLEDGFVSLKVVRGAATFRENDRLWSLAALEALGVVEGDLGIDNNLILEQIDLPALTEVGGSIAVHSHPKLQRLGLPQVAKAAGALILAYNGDGSEGLELDLGLLSDVHGHADVVHNGGAPISLDLEGLATVDGHLNVFHNTGLEQLDLPLLARTADALDVSNNSALAQLSCENLTEVAGHLRVHSNPSLERAAFPELPELAGDLYLAHNGSEALALELAFPSLTDVDGAMTIEGNAHYVGESGWSSLERVGGPLIVTENDGLAGLSVPNLSSIGGELRIEHNGSLVTLAALAGLDTLGGALTVLENPALPTCQAFALRGWLVTAGWVGAWTIDDNAHDACSP